ncbi:hypothetical protein PM082_022284 [Marasmius tenuissimus]|nr:hypothetical protein PM082_022284 [Marasmius tenuissimus]
MTSSSKHRRVGEFASKTNSSHPSRRRELRRTPLTDNEDKDGGNSAWLMTPPRDMWLEFVLSREYNDNSCKRGMWRRRRRISLNGNGIIAMPKRVRFGKCAITWKIGTICLTGSLPWGDSDIIPEQDVVVCGLPSVTDIGVANIRLPPTAFIFQQ